MALVAASASAAAVTVAPASSGSTAPPAVQVPPRFQVKPLQLGPSLSLWPPLLSAPMAGISSAPYRRLATSHGAAMATSEMVIASTLLVKNRRSRKLASFAPEERLRSVQLYGVKPEQLEQAVRKLVSECGVQHVDLNFGCPVRKITARGGGSALPLRPRLFAKLVAAAVAGARGEAPVTVKFRVGLTPELPTHLQAGRIAEAEGAAALVLHARTADQLYSSPVDWAAVRALVGAVSIPVVGNGDVFEGADALRLLRETGCAGVMVGRAAVGRPWVFGEVAAALTGAPPPPPPRLGEVVAAALRHAEMEVEWYRGYHDGEKDTLLRFRKFIKLYLLGFGSCDGLQSRLFAAESLDQWRAAVYDGAGELYDAAEPFPAAAVRFPRLKGGGPLVRQRMGLPDGWLEEARGGGGRAEAQLTDDACEG
ncbi:hypothetical protein HYH02_002416 [Chlamydomonas schloesseri]|uniref:tRNA-dihydrouridine(47) synthase [NAD(P)(+)] n=1 Tax=Chlamydomonas schloesseri TaxID=2026947 RepID=A0A836BBQ0_9CHLO|nr:hypothetical protein HYH02_002416 [Chlamydomonas schloesseri]|eukprot:KAG2453084.1 hypothetical protein HYH02_002416 [Chlamydomonas schloesseri]